MITYHQKVQVQARTGLSPSTIENIYLGRRCREASYNRLLAVVEELGLPKPPPRNAQ
jgi:hypothetical protein